MKRVLFVCTGNICRSPTAEAIARHWAGKLGINGEVEFDSAGTHAYHAGEAPDLRATRAAEKRGYDLSRLRARPVHESDYEHFDLILAMDRGHLAWLRQTCPPQHLHKLSLFLSYSESQPDADVPDPYYGGRDGFENVLDMCEEAILGLLDRYR